MRSHQHHRGFTLIELLVVISIISLLIAILLPALKKSRVTAERLKCAVAVRQNALGMIYYTADWKDRLPDFTVSPIWNWNNSTVAWDMTRRENLGTYLGITTYNPYGFKLGVTACPTTSQLYYYNAYILGFDQFDVWEAPMPISRIKRPTEVYWGGDYISGPSEFYGHEGSRVYSFVDGHAKSFDEETMGVDLLGGDFFNTKAHPY